MIDIKLTEEEFRMVQYCIEFISAEERDFDKDGEKAIKSIAEYSWEMGENHGYYLGKNYGNINKGE